MKKKMLKLLVISFALIVGTFTNVHAAGDYYFKGKSVDINQSAGLADDYGEELNPILVDDKSISLDFDLNLGDLDTVVSDYLFNGVLASGFINSIKLETAKNEMKNVTPLTGITADITLAIASEDIETIRMTKADLQNILDTSSSTVTRKLKIVNEPQWDATTEQMLIVVTTKSAAEVGRDFFSLYGLDLLDDEGNYLPLNIDFEIPYENVILKQSSFDGTSETATITTKVVSGEFNLEIPQHLNDIIHTLEETGTQSQKDLLGYQPQYQNGSGHIWTEAIRPLTPIPDNTPVIRIEALTNNGNYTYFTVDGLYDATEYKGDNLYRGDRPGFQSWFKDQTDWKIDVLIDESQLEADMEYNKPWNYGDIFVKFPITPEETNFDVFLGGKVTAKYIDANTGLEINESETTTGVLTRSYSTEQKEVTGYNFKQVQVDSASPTGVYAAGNTYVIYEYDKIPNEIKVTFDYQDGRPNDVITINEGETVTKPVNPTRDGYKFLGWSLTEKDAKDTYFDFTTPISVDTTLYGHWKLIPVEQELPATGLNNNSSLISSAMVLLGVATILKGIKKRNSTKLY